MAILLYCSIIICGSKAFTQQKSDYIFRHIDQSDGLLHTMINSIVQDSKGYIWILTPNGLQRYDGSGFVNYPYDANDAALIKNTWDADLFADKTNNCLWVTNGGIEKWDLRGNKFVLYPSEKILTDSILKFNIYKDSAGGSVLVSDFGLYQSYKTGNKILKNCKTLMVCPLNMRKQLELLINKEIKAAKAKKPAAITLKMNSMSDTTLITKLQEAAAAGVEVKMIIRGIYSALKESKKATEKYNITAISIVDEYLEHARVLIFHNGGKEKVFISSADWMVRNLDHRIEAAIPITNPVIRQELKDIIHIQLRDNVKARWLDNELMNNYVSFAGKKKVRSQIETYQYLYQKTLKPSNSEISSNRHRK